MCNSLISLWDSLVLRYETSSQSAHETSKLRVITCNQQVGGVCTWDQQVLKPASWESAHETSNLGVYTWDQQVGSLQVRPASRGSLHMRSASWEFTRETSKLWNQQVGVCTWDQQVGSLHVRPVSCETSMLGICTWNQQVVKPASWESTCETIKLGVCSTGNWPLHVCYDIHCMGFKPWLEAWFCWDCCTSLQTLLWCLIWLQPYLRSGQKIQAPHSFCQLNIKDGKNEMWHA